MEALDVSATTSATAICTTTTTDKGEKTLTFVPEFPQAGSYEVRLAYSRSTNRATKVPVRIFHADGEDTVHVNEQVTPPSMAASFRWARFRFEKGEPVVRDGVERGGERHVIVDAVQFLPEATPAADQNAARSPSATRRRRLVEGTGSGTEEAAGERPGAAAGDGGERGEADRGHARSASAATSTTAGVGAARLPAGGDRRTRCRPSRQGERPARTGRLARQPATTR